ncbi:hypothetical protein [Klebsiella pneumoniae]
MLYDIHLLNTITAPSCRRMMVMGDSQRFSARNWIRLKIMRSR